MENLLSDQRKFEKVTLKNDAFPNFLVDQEKRIDTILKNLVDSNSMSKEMRKFVKPVGTKPGIMTLKLYANKVNLQPQCIENLHLVGYIVTLKVFYLRLINLVWYIL